MLAATIRWMLIRPTVDRAAPTIMRRRLGTRTVTLVRGPGVDQGAVDSVVVRRQQSLTSDIPQFFV